MNEIIRRATQAAYAQVRYVDNGEVAADPWRFLTHRDLTDLYVQGLIDLSLLESGLERVAL